MKYIQKFPMLAALVAMFFALVLSSATGSAQIVEATRPEARYELVQGTEFGNVQFTNERVTGRRAGFVPHLPDTAAMANEELLQPAPIGQRTRAILARQSLARWRDMVEGHNMEDPAYEGQGLDWVIRDLERMQTDMLHPDLGHDHTTNWTRGYVMRLLGKLNETERAIACHSRSIEECVPVPEAGDGAYGENLLQAARGIRRQAPSLDINITECQAVCEGEDVQQCIARHLPEYSVLDWSLPYEDVHGPACVAGQEGCARRRLTMTSARTCHSAVAWHEATVRQLEANWRTTHPEEVRQLAMERQIEHLNGEVARLQRFRRSVETAPLRAMIAKGRDLVNAIVRGPRTLAVALIRGTVGPSRTEAVATHAPITAPGAATTAATGTAANATPATPPTGVPRALQNNRPYHAASAAYPVRLQGADQIACRDVDENASVVECIPTGPQGILQMVALTAWTELGNGMNVRGLFYASWTAEAGATERLARFLVENAGENGRHGNVILACPADSTHDTYHAARWNPGRRSTVGAAVRQFVRSRTCHEGRTRLWTVGSRPVRVALDPSAHRDSISGSPPPRP